MQLTINDKQVTLKQSFRSMMIYEKIAGETFTPKGITEILIYLYSTILASDRDIALTWDDFINWIDDNPNTLEDFSNWLVSTLTKNKMFSDDGSGSGKDSTSLKKN